MESAGRAENGPGPGPGQGLGPGPGPGQGSPPPIRAGLQAALTDALRRRDKVAASALRSGLSALANAEAVSPVPLAGTSSPHIAGAAAGLGAAEAPRRSLSPAGAQQVIAAEISERQTAADGYDRSGHRDRAEQLRREADVLRAAAGL
jgi:uncharacterized protein YqeY